MSRVHTGYAACKGGRLFHIWVCKQLRGSYEAGTGSASRSAGESFVADVWETFRQLQEDIRRLLSKAVGLMQQLFSSVDISRLAVRTGGKHHGRQQL